MRQLNVALLVALILLGLAWELVLAPLPGGTGALALKVLPLTLAIAGMLKHRLYTYRWMSLLVWLYFTEGVVRVTGDGGMSRVLAGLELAVSIGLFATLYRSAVPTGVPPPPRPLPAPQLRTDEASELRKLEAKQRAALDGYRWIDRDNGVIAIPLNKAMDLIASRGVDAYRPVGGSGPAGGAP